MNRLIDGQVTMEEFVASTKDITDALNQQNELILSRSRSEVDE